MSELFNGGLLPKMIVKIQRNGQIVVQNFGTKAAELSNQKQGILMVRK